MDISLNMSKDLKGIDFIINLTTMRLWNQEKQSFFKMT